MLELSEHKVNGKSFQHILCHSIKLKRFIESVKILKRLQLTDNAHLSALLCMCPATVGVGSGTIHILGTSAVWEDTQGTVLGLLGGTGVH